MDKTEARELARSELSLIESAGYVIASEHIDSVILKNVTAASGTVYEVEISYLSEGAAHEDILVICRVTSIEWFSHQHIEESLRLCNPTQ